MAARGVKLFVSVHRNKIRVARNLIRVYHSIKSHKESSKMDWIKAVTTLKAHAGVQTDKDLCSGIIGFHPTNLTSVKKGGATFVNIEKLCNAHCVKPSTFIAWGES